MSWERKLIYLLVWLLGAVAAPAQKVGTEPAPEPLLVTASGKTISTRRAWARERARLLRSWQAVLGPLPRRKPPLNAEILGTETLPDFTRRHVRYQVEPGVFTDGYLLLPVNLQARLPAVIVFHPTTPFQARAVAGLEAGYPEEKWQGVHLVRQGYVVWCPRNYINADGADWVGNARRVRAAHTNWTGMTRMVWDAIRAVDYVSSLPQVNARRIGVLGHSLGGKQALYAAAFDPRIKAAVSSEGGLGLRQSNWEAEWYLGPAVREPGFALEHHQLLALVAPRPFLLIGGESADGTASEPLLDAARPVYALLGAERELEWFNHHQGHQYPPAARARSEEFLARHLQAAK